MKPTELLRILSVAEKLKCNTRHCYTSSGRHESVAEHSWRIALMAMLITPEFPEADVRKEDALFDSWVQTLPEDTREEFSGLLAEMNALETLEARIYKALDKMEAVIQHDESDISTWIPLEYDLQLRYGAENVTFSPWFQSLKAEIDNWTRRKIAENK